MAADHSPKYDLAGKRFGRLTAIRFIKGGKWLCRCDCGNEVEVWTASLMGGHTTSCKCTWHAISHRRTHGQTDSAEYKVWCGIKRRCLNENDKSYPRYGGRGIQICDRWKLSFEAFLQDMGPRPSKSHEIDRIDNDGHYEPGNCRWATKRKQTHNRRTNFLVTYNGETKCLAEWQEITGIHWATIKYRINHGWSAEKALTTPVTQ